MLAKTRLWSETRASLPFDGQVPRLHSDHRYKSSNLARYPKHHVFCFFESFLESFKRRSSLAFGVVWESDEDVSIVIDSADMPVPDLGKLPRVSSQYLSHYETVPNPFKDSLRWQLDYAKSQVSYAESSYEQAVRSYNWDSSDWNLNRANSAYSDYKSAINNYNMLVDQFNMTPSTVQQPVFLFIPFRKGAFSSAAGFP